MINEKLEWQRGKMPKFFGVSASTSAEKIRDYHFARIEGDIEIKDEEIRGTMGLLDAHSYPAELTAYIWNGPVVGSARDSWWNWEIQCNGRRIAHGEMYASQETALRSPHGLYAWIARRRRKKA